MGAPETTSGEPRPAPPAGLRGGRAYALFLAVALLLGAIDLVTKHLAFSRIGPSEVVVVIPDCFNLIQAKNYGVAFSFLWGARWPIVAISAVAFAIVSWFSWSAKNAGVGYQVTLGMIASGVIGNVHDRVRLGYVRDFLDVYAGANGGATASWFVQRFGTQHWPTFNVADSCICVGTAFLLVKLWRDERAAERAAREAAAKDGPKGAVAPVRATERAGA